MVAIPENTHDLGDGYETIPPGEYLVEIAHIDCRQSKRTGSDYLSVKFRILGGDHVGRSVFTNLNLWHPDDKAQWFAQKELQDICDACQLDRKDITETEQLEAKKLLVKIIHRTVGDRIFINVDRYSPAPGSGKVAEAKAGDDSDIPW